MGKHNIFPDFCYKFDLEIIVGISDFIDKKLATILLFLNQSDTYLKFYQKKTFQYLWIYLKLIFF